jgi:hypothetical protein
MAHLLEQQDRSDDAGNRDGDRQNIGKLIDAEEENREAVRVQSGKLSNFFKPHDEKSCDKAGYAQKKNLKIAAE